jgi:KaiC/GvpD/RAD55 family RecA-like ATPase
MTEQTKEENSKLQEGAKRVLDKMAEIMENAKNDGVSEPFSRPVQITGNILTSKPNDAKIKKEIYMIKSGTFLDQFFFNVDDKPLGGIPKVAQIGIVGNPDVGKSLIAREIALRLASEGHKVIFTTSEDIFQSDNDRFDLQSRMKQMADFLHLNWEKIKQNLFVLDIIAHSQLRDWNTLVNTYRILIETEKVEYLIVDSLTLLDDYRAGLKYHLGEFVRYNQANGVTGIFISQKATEDAVDQHGLAGGIALSHLLDIEFEINFKKVWSGDAQMKIDTEAKQGEILHFIRVLKCRLGKADMRYHKLQITKDGILSMVK